MINSMFPILSLSAIGYLACAPHVGLTTIANPLQIPLKTGIFAGVATHNGTEQWLGIPYAQPPLGILRFKTPLFPKASQDVRDASQFGNACPQPPSNSLGAAIGEDCLVLNVRRILLHAVLTVAACALRYGDLGAQVQMLDSRFWCGYM